MRKTITLKDNYSTTRRVIKVDPSALSDLVKESKNPEDKFETLMFQPKAEGRQGEGGLRTKGYFKFGRFFDNNQSFSTKDNIDQKEKSIMPLVTVVTVVFNGESTLEETILSVINQSYDNVEYIIIDGRYTDGTLDIMKKYENFIDYWVSEKDEGIYDAMNKGIKLASGQWVNFINSGDWFYRNNVLVLIFPFKNTNKVQIIYGDHEVRYASGGKN